MRDKRSLIPHVLGAEFLQRPNGLTYSWSYLECYELRLIKNASRWLARLGRQMEKACRGICLWRNFLICFTQGVKSLYDHSNPAQRQISPTWFRLNPEAWWRRFDSYATQTLRRHSDGKSHWSQQHGRLSSHWQRVRYSKYGAPAVWRAAEKQEEAFHLIGSRTKPWPSMQLQPCISPKKRQTRGAISVFISNT